MAGRAAVSLLGGLGRGAVALGAMLILAFATAVTSACSAAPIPFERVATHPGTIGLVQVLDIARNPQAPDRYRFAVASEDGVPLVVALLAIASGVLGAAVLVAALARRWHRDERR